MSPGPHPTWSIGIYSGPGPLQLAPAPGISQPVLTGADATDVEAHSVADPFLLHRNGRWQMFFEVVNAHSGRGEIARAESGDGLSWSYQGVVLRESIHLSYPYVFEIRELSETAYNERELTFKPAIAASGSGWNAVGMHHLDATPRPGGGWLGAVDGVALRRR